MSVRVGTILQETATGGSLAQAMKVIMLESMRVDPGPLMDCNVALLTNASTLTPKSVIGDIAVPGWTGYVNQELVSNPATPANTNGATIEFVSNDWASASDADDTIDGVAILSSGGTVLAGYAIFDEPLPVDGIQTITVVAVWLWD